MNEGGISATKFNPVLRFAALMFQKLQPSETPAVRDAPVVVRLDDAMRSVALDLAAGGRQRFGVALDAANGDGSAEALCCETLIGAFRRLWEADECDDVEISIGLSLALSELRQRTAARALDAAADPERPILVVALPGETHLLGAAAAAHAFEDAGRNVVYQLPATRDELCRLVMARRFQWVVLVTSGIYSRASIGEFVQYCIDGLATYSDDRLKIAMYGRFAELPGVSDYDSLALASNHLQDLIDVVPLCDRHVH
jgi:hypothetical protein